MALDQDVRRAVAQAVEKHGQDPDLGLKIASWCEALAVGNETLDDMASFHRRIEVLLQGIRLTPDDSEGGSG